MPYILTTVRETRQAYERRRVQDPGAHRNQHAERLAVATVDDARSVIGYSTCLPSGRHITNAREITQDGGTVGPLPDGTTITVQPVPWDRLGAEVGENIYRPTMGIEQLLAAWNDAHGSGVAS